jgi:hypothetical protein
MESRIVFDILFQDCTRTWTILAFRIFLFILWNVTEHVCVSRVSLSPSWFGPTITSLFPSEWPESHLSSQNFKTNWALSYAICLPLNISTPPCNLSRNAGIRDCYIFIGSKVSVKCTQLRDIWDALAGDTTKASRPGTVGCCGVGGVTVVQQPQYQQSLTCKIFQHYFLFIF